MFNFDGIPTRGVPDTDEGIDDKATYAQDG